MSDQEPVGEYPKAGTGVFIWTPSKSKFLLQQRARGCGTGKWSVPGGRIEYGETVEETGCREVLEETGLKIFHITPATVTSSICGECPEHWITVWLEAFWAGEKPRISEEAGAYQWRDPLNLPYGLWDPHWNLLMQTSWWHEVLMMRHKEKNSNE
jgi:8-oxo-dGTP diphosphatase